MRTQVVFATIAVLSIITGLPLAGRRVPPNRWYGLRLPATFADDSVWYDANAVTGRDLIALGVALLAVAFGLPFVIVLSPAAYAAVCTVVLVVCSVILTVRGWRIANRLLRQRSAKREVQHGW